MFDASLAYPALPDQALGAVLGTVLFVLAGSAAIAWRSGGSAGAGGQDSRPLRRLPSLANLRKQPWWPGRRQPSANRLGRAAEWVAEIEQANSVLTMDAAQLKGASHPILDDDHMFSALLQHGLLEDMDGFYNEEQRRFYAVVSLGRNTAGHPKIVHGGLTAALIDETLGGLMFALKNSQAIALPGPMFTVQLDVSYKSMIPAGVPVLCTAEVESLEGRKLWMRASVTDGPGGGVYATARALFIALKQPAE